MKPEDIAKKIDHTLLKPNAPSVDSRRLFRESFKYNFRAVCINEVALDGMPANIRKRLKSNGILIACVLDFPLGQGGYINKHFGATLAREKGADELDVVWNIGAFLDGYHEQVLRELKSVANVLPTKVIVEVDHILNSSKSSRKVMQLLKDAAHLVRESGAICIKDHTGFGVTTPVEARSDYIQIWKKAEPDLLIKSAAGIKTLDAAKMLIEAGADILGTSAGDKILEEVMKSAKG